MPDACIPRCTARNRAKDRYKKCGSASRAEPRLEEGDPLPLSNAGLRSCVMTTVHYPRIIRLTSSSVNAVRQWRVLAAKGSGLWISRFRPDLRGTPCRRRAMPPAPASEKSEWRSVTPTVCGSTVTAGWPARTVDARGAAFYDGVGASDYSGLHPARHRQRPAQLTGRNARAHHPVSKASRQTRPSERIMPLTLRTQLVTSAVLAAFAFASPPMPRCRVDAAESMAPLIRFSRRRHRRSC